MSDLVLVRPELDQTGYDGVLAVTTVTPGRVSMWAEPHLSGEHSDVMKLSASSLLHRNRQKEAGPVSGEHGFLVLWTENRDDELSVETPRSPSRTGRSWRTALITGHHPENVLSDIRQRFNQICLEGDRMKVYLLREPQLRAFLVSLKREPVHVSSSTIKAFPP